MNPSITCACGKQIPLDVSGTERPTHCPECGRELPAAGVTAAETAPRNESKEAAAAKRKRWSAIRWLRMATAALTIIVIGGILAGAWYRYDQAQIPERSRENLRQIGQAMLRYSEDHRGRLPPAVLYDRSGRPLHSWRVLILPYLGKQSLYARFRLDEPWDSLHNSSLMSEMPAVYSPPGWALWRERYSTFYQVLDGPPATTALGPDGAFDSKYARETALRFGESSRADDPRASAGLLLSQSSELRTFTDWHGARNTILAVEAGEAVPWTNPHDLPISWDKPLPQLGGLFRGDFNMVTADGAVHFVERKKTSDDVLKKNLCPEPPPSLDGPDW